MPPRDVFICHASGDKRQYAKPLAEALSRRAVSCWIDEAEIEVGDSIVDAVNTGLRLSRFVLVVITEEFFGRNWTVRELNAALYKELSSGRKVVLPVLAITPDRWLDAYPLIGDKAFLQWDDGLDSIADAVAKLFDRKPANEWAHNHPTNYVGKVWVRCTPGDETDTSASLTLRWGPYVRHVDIVFRGGTPVSFAHHKTGHDSVTLHASVEPATIVTFGIGPAPDGGLLAQNIDEGWSRAAGIEVEHPTFTREGEPPKDRDLLAEILDSGLDA
jgi:hypothetical protein